MRDMGIWIHLFNLRPFLTFFANKATCKTPGQADADHYPASPSKPITPPSVETGAMIDRHGRQEHALNLLEFGPTRDRQIRRLFLTSGDFPDFDVIDTLDGPRR